MKRMSMIIAAGLLLLSLSVFAQKKKPAPAPEEGWKASAVQHLDNAYDQYKNIALQIWGHAELGYKEVKSSALLQETLKKEGFSI
jgi:aminobenzoyl-glutamate utilization protein B